MRSAKETERIKGETKISDDIAVSGTGVTLSLGLIARGWLALGNR